ncbi:Ras-related protein Rab-24 [Tritrichomonas foetus]|uniref:Ras-related protein Rab-24 n=1 Tax=Tritrichomonas foetus TaxID=1144522 RepID=A0A1J4KML0_9EUKA|nr:Ras-related protein Rab-24 [Tritrichomonas foetus]|eukprot:OHT10926.1 Ras-related protein Rab-24 [Tritrichomonas foetus]
MTTQHSASQASIKLIIVGTSGVGKTSLIASFFHRKFDINPNQTVAPAFCGANIQIDNNMTVDLQIWDTAGQEQYQSISQMFYRDAKVAFVCYERANEEYVTQWVSRVRNNVPECNIILITTKSDTLTQDEVIEEKVNSKKIADIVQASSHFVTSAKTGESVQEAFHAAAKYAKGGPQHETRMQKLDLDQENNKNSCC